MSRGPSWFRAHAGRRDANHATIRDGLRSLGHFVVDVASVGDGVPDLLVYPKCACGMPKCPREVPVWLELKADKGKLRDSQEGWRASAHARGIRVVVARTLEQAIAALGPARILARRLDDEELEIAYGR